MLELTPKPLVFTPTKDVGTNSINGATVEVLIMRPFHCPTTAIAIGKVTGKATSTASAITIAIATVILIAIAIKEIAIVMIIAIARKLATKIEKARYSKKLTDIKKE